MGVGERMLVSPGNSYELPERRVAEEGLHALRCRLSTSRRTKAGRPSGLHAKISQSTWDVT